MLPIALHGERMHHLVLQAIAAGIQLRLVMAMRITHLDATAI
jgi:hypothetical protein